MHIISVSQAVTIEFVLSFTNMNAGNDQTEERRADVFDFLLLVHKTHSKVT